MHNKIIKVCGLKNPENIQEIANTSVDWQGFIFYPKSPRFVSEDNYKKIRAIEGKTKVGVFVNESIETVRLIANQCDLQMVQLHGHETPEYCQELRDSIPVMKAISIKNENDLHETEMYEGFVDYFLFDTKKAGMYGGTGEKFSWDVLKAYTGKTPFILSGGIQISDIENLNAFHHELCIGYDINSGFEIEPGSKDVGLVKQFLEQIKET